MQRRSKKFKRNALLRYTTEYQGQKIGVDEYLEPSERETSFNFAEGNQYLSIYTHTLAMMKGLLRCPQFEVTAVELALIKGTEEHPNRNRHEKVVGLQGRLPIGMLTLKQPRSTNEIKRIISPRIKGQTQPLNVDLRRPGVPQTTRKSPEEGRPYLAPAPTSDNSRSHSSNTDSDWHAWVYGGAR